MTETFATAPSGRPAPAEPYRTGALVSFLRLNWFIRLRWGFVLAAFAVLALERVAAPATPRPWQLIVIIVAVAVCNVIWTGLSRLLRNRFAAPDAVHPDGARSAQLFANAQVALDLLLLTLILYFTGGVENPMMMFYVFHIAIGALLLQKRQAILQAVWAVALFAVMALGDLNGWLPHFRCCRRSPRPAGTKADRSSPSRGGDGLRHSRRVIFHAATSPPAWMSATSSSSPRTTPCAVPRPPFTICRSGVRVSCRTRPISSSRRWR